MSEQAKPPTAKERQRQKETSEAARKSIEAQQKAKELTQAAAGAGDPEERQKLLEEALEKEVEAETFGKTAKYLNSGTFQGLCAGAGLGGGIGVWLGTLTGTIVGGTTGIVTGGIGGGLGSMIGAAHGPFFSVGKAMGEGIRKITGDIPGWKATDEQKGALDKMINGVKEQERPPEEELTQLSQGGSIVAGKGYTGEREADEGEKGILQGGKPSMPYIPGVTSKKKTKDKPTHSKVEQAPQPSAAKARKMEDQYEEFAGQGVASTTATEKGPTANGGGKKRSNGGRRVQVSTTQAEAPSQPIVSSRKSTRVPLQGRSTSTGAKHVPVGEKKYSVPSEPPKKKPRKLEIRSATAR